MESGSGVYERAKREGCNSRTFGLTKLRQRPILCQDGAQTTLTTNPHAKYYNGNPLTVLLERFCVESDGIIVATPDLAIEYNRLNQRTFVCYNALDDVHFSRLAPRVLTGRAKRSDQIRVGYFGSDTHSADFEMIAPALSGILRRFPKVRLVFLGQNHRSRIPEDLWDQTEYPGGTASHAGLRYDDPNEDAVTEPRLAVLTFYAAAVQLEVDIAVAPIESNTFNRCKSYLKILEYGMLGIPTVASCFGPYVEYQRAASEPVVYLAASEEEWKSALSELIESEAARRELARANRDYIADAHLMSRGVVAWEDAIEATIAEARIDDGAAAVESGPGVA